MPATKYAINKTLNRIFRQEPYASTTPGTMPFTNNWYLGLSLTPIDDDGNGVTEPKDRAYARVPLPRTTGAIWTSGSTTPPGSVTNKSAITFKQTTQHWGTIQEIFLATHPTSFGSSIWFHAKLEPAIPILDGTKIVIPANSIKINRQE